MSFRATHNIYAYIISCFPETRFVHEPDHKLNFLFLASSAYVSKWRASDVTLFLPISSNQSLIWWKKTMQRSMIYLHFQPSIIWENFRACIYYITLKFLSQSLPEATIFCPFFKFHPSAKNYNGFTCAQTQLDNLINISLIMIDLCMTKTLAQRSALHWQNR